MNDFEIKEIIMLAKTKNYSAIIIAIIGVQFLVNSIVMAQQTIRINGGQYSFTYNLNDTTTSCNLLESPNVQNNIKCLILCQQTGCQTLQFDASTNNCTIVGAKPNLIQYETLQNITLTYILGKILDI